MATLNFGATDRKVFTPVSSALGALSAGAGTIIVLIRKTAQASADFCGLTDSTAANYYHALSQTGTDFLIDDENHTGPTSATAATDDTTNWWWYAGDWASGAASLERFHWRNQTSGGSWTHANSTGNNGGTFTGPGTSGWMRIGYIGDNSGAGKDIALVAVWAGTRFSDTDYASWSKTSDLYSHPLGAPTFLCEVNATTLVDLIGGSTYSSANSTGTTLTGADPPSFTFDGVGSAPSIMPVSFQPVLFPLAPSVSGFGPLILPQQVGIDLGATATPVTGSDSGAGTDTGTVSATVPGSDSGAGTDSGTVSATASGSETGSGTDAGAVAASVGDSETGSGTDTGSGTATASSNDSATATETGTVSATLSDSDSGAGTDVQVSIVSPVSGTDTSTGTDSGTVAASGTGSESGASTETSSASATGTGGETGSGSDSASTSVTATGSDSGAGADAGTVSDITGGPLPVSGTDDGTGTETGSVVDVTPAAPPATGGDGGTGFEEGEDFSTADLRAKTGHDHGQVSESSQVVDLTTRLRPLTFLRKPRPTEAGVSARETGTASETASLVVLVASGDAGRGADRQADLFDETTEAEDERFILSLLGVDV